MVDVAEDVPEMLRFLDEIGVRPGAVVEVVARGPLGGPVTLAAPAGAMRSRSNSPGSSRSNLAKPRCERA